MWWGCGTRRSRRFRRPNSKLRRPPNHHPPLSKHVHSTFLPVVPRFLLRLLEISGDGRLWFPIPLALLPFSHHTSILLLLDLHLVGLLKHLVRCPRPVYNPAVAVAVALDQWSFPSGHSSRMFFVASSLRPVVGRGLGLVVAVWAVGFERAEDGRGWVGGRRAGGGRRKWTRGIWGRGVLEMEVGKSQNLIPNFVKI